MCRKAATAIIGKPSAGVKGKTLDVVASVRPTPLYCCSVSYGDEPCAEAWLACPIQAFWASVSKTPQTPFSSFFMDIYVT
jgi:hypothetical protein